METSVVSTDAARPPGQALDRTLWIVQAMLALMFGLAGVMKTSMPIAELARKLPWAADVPGPLVRFIGACEMAGALAMLIPAVTRIRPVLTPLAGVGLATVMILAMGFHLSRGEAPVVGMPLALGGLSVFVAWGRFRGAPIAPGP